MEFHLDADFSLMTIMSYTAYQGEALCVCVCGRGQVPCWRMCVIMRQPHWEQIKAELNRKLAPERKLWNCFPQIASYYFTRRIATSIDGYIRGMRRRWQLRIAASMPRAPLASKGTGKKNVLWIWRFLHPWLSMTDLALLST